MARPAIRASSEVLFSVLVLAAPKPDGATLLGILLYNRFLALTLLGLECVFCL